MKSDSEIRWFLEWLAGTVVCVVGAFILFVVITHFAEVNTLFRVVAICFAAFGVSAMVFGFSIPSIILSAILFSVPNAA